MALGLVGQGALHHGASLLQARASLLQAHASPAHAPPPSQGPSMLERPSAIDDLPQMNGFVEGLRAACIFSSTHRIKMDIKCQPCIPGVAAAS